MKAQFAEDPASGNLRPHHLDHQLVHFLGGGQGEQLPGHQHAQPFALVIPGHEEPQLAHVFFPSVPGQLDRAVCHDLIPNLSHDPLDSTHSDAFYPRLDHPLLGHVGPQIGTVIQGKFLEKIQMEVLLKNLYVNHIVQ